MAQEFAKTFAQENRQRLVAGVMGYFEREMLPQMPANVRSQALRAMRGRVQQCVGQYHDFVLDLIKSLPEDQVLNEEAFRLLERIHQDMRDLRASG